MDSSSEDDEPIFVDLTTRPSVIIIDFRDDDNSPDFQPTTLEVASNGEVLRQYRGIPDGKRNATK